MPRGVIQHQSLRFQSLVKPENSMPADHRSLQQLTAAWATFITRAERPLPFSSRDGSILRLVPTNERLSQDQLRGLLVQLLIEQQHLLETFQSYLPGSNSRDSAARRTAAWARGWCYLQAGNNRQALKDANTAMAYAAAAAGSKATTAALKPAAPSSTAIAGTPPVTVAEGLADYAGGDGTASTHSTHPHTAESGAAEQVHKEPATTVNCWRTSALPSTACSWVPALLLAAECHAALGNVSPAVVLLAQAAQEAPSNSVVADRLAALARQLPLEQGLAWRSGSLPGLLQQLQNEAEMKLPEVLRPRPKWYYYNKWMTQRIHTALLELHLRCSLSSGGQLEGPSSEQLMLAAEAAADTPAIAAAAAAAGFSAAPLAAVKHDVHQVQAKLPLQLPGPVVDKLLSLDAGDLDLMIKHPTALQAQVYEMLDVLELQGTAALEDYAVPHLSWQEVQALAAVTADGDAAADPVVGLPLGYSPPHKQPALPAGVVALLPTTAPATAHVSSAVPCLEATAAATADTSQGEVDCPDRASKDRDDVSSKGSNLGLVAACKAAQQQVGLPVDANALGWRQKGWKRSDYLTGCN